MSSPQQLGRTHLSAETDPGLRTSLQRVQPFRTPALPATGVFSLISGQLLLCPVSASILSTFPGSPALSLFHLASGTEVGLTARPKPHCSGWGPHQPHQASGEGGKKSRRAWLWVAGRLLGLRHTQKKPSREISQFCNRPAYQVGKEQLPPNTENWVRLTLG